jgi:hypothetical protein
VTLGTTIFFGALAILISWLDAWRAIGSWLAEQSVTTLAVGLPTALAAVLAVIAFAGIRRVVP